jgi:hypothetical protein
MLNQAICIFFLIIILQVTLQSFDLLRNKEISLFFPCMFFFFFLGLDLHVVLFFV